MKTQHKVLAVVSVVIVLSMILVACSTPAPAPTAPPAGVTKVVETQVVKEVATQVVQATVLATQIVEKVVQVTPTPEPSNRTGAWVDQMVFTSVDDANAAVSQLQAGELDLYAYQVSNTELYKKVKDAKDLVYSNSFGSFNEITFNNSVCMDPKTGKPATDKLNPFSNPKIREAVNYLIDRNYVQQEIFGGLGYAKWQPVPSAFPDYARYVDTYKALESQYAYNPDKAKQIIQEEIQKMGATVGSDGKIQFNGQPLSLFFIIRTEDARKQIGDYVANQLETVGFTVDREYKTRSEASPLWVRSNPADCLWLMYTGGWITTAISRDNGPDYSFYYTPNDYSIPLFQAYQPSKEFNDVALKLRNHDYKDMTERADLMTKAATLALQDSARVWVIDQNSFTPQRSNVSVAYDLAGGVAGSMLYPYTIRFNGQEGGVMRVAQPGIMVDPWNPLGGSNWIYDAMPQRATMEHSFVYDPYTGLAWPDRAEKMDVVAKTGLPIAKTLDWVSLNFQDKIEVPADAWVNWDCKNQKFITASEAFTSTQTANVKYTVTYPKDMFQTMKWHDGSPLTIGDFIMSAILTWDPGCKDSKLYDPAIEQTVNAFKDHFKGFKIVSTDPLVIEYYDNSYQLDAELSWLSADFFPNYLYGTGGWHNMGLGDLAVENKKLAFTADQAAKNKVEWMSYISGPSLEILKGFMDKATKDNYLPFAPTMSQYVKADEIAARWKNLNDWYTAHNNFWVGLGPFEIYKVFPTERTMTLQRFADFPDKADRWAKFGAPQLAEVTVDGPGQVAKGTEATFDIGVTYNGQPYPSKDIAAVKFLVFNGGGALVAKGDAKMSEEGKYTATLTADQSNNLTSGPYKFTAVVVPQVVSVPGFATMDFVVP